MNIHEYQAKSLLDEYGIRVPRGVVIESLNDVDVTLDNFSASKYVVKAQVHAGGRGKAGGIVVTDSLAEAKAACRRMLNQIIVTKQTGPAGKLISKVYVENACNILREYYCSMLVNRDSNTLSLVLCTEGGVDIEEVAALHPEKMHMINIDPAIGLTNFLFSKIAYILKLPKECIKELQQTISGIYSLFVEHDASMVEINPLVLSPDNKLLVLDTKISFDDNALFRNKNIAALRDPSQENELENRAGLHGLNYIKMDGNIGCMVNGAGLAMATMDVIKLYGASPANFLDVGGGTDVTRVAAALEIILSDPSAKAILVNIFGGIVHCDVVAAGIVAASKKVNLTIPMVVRLAGTNADMGKKILDESGLSIVSADDLSDAAQKVIKLV